MVKFIGHGGIVFTPLYTNSLTAICVGTALLYTVDVGGGILVPWKQLLRRGVRSSHTAVAWNRAAMSTSPATNSYQHHRLPTEIISHAVRLYFRFCLSDREVEALLCARGVLVTHEALRQWSRKCGHP